MNIVKPRIDRRNNTNGITGSHFPAYEWVLALISKILGFSETLARIYSLMLFTIGMFAFYKFINLLGFDSTFSIIGPLILLSLPQNYYDSMNAMPDVMALSLSLLSVYFLTHFFKKGNHVFFILGIIFTMLSGLIKFQFLIIPMSSIVYIKWNKKVLLEMFLGVGVVVTAVVLWYLYAIKLTNLNNLREYGLWIKPITIRRIIETLKGNLISDLPELLLGWPLLILTAVILKQFKFNNPINSQIIIGLIGFLLFYIIAIERMQHHSYYFMVLLPFLVLLILNLFNESKYSIKILILFCGLNFIWSFVRIIPSRWSDGGQGIPLEFKNKEQRNRLINGMKSSKICLLGPDVSGCIYFYFTNTKGYSFENFDELFIEKNQIKQIDEMRQNGLNRILIYRTKSTVEKMRLIEDKKLIDQVGGFDIWDLQPIKSNE